MVSFFKHYLSRYTVVFLSSVIVVLIVVTRFLSLGDLPKGLHADEASFLLNTVSFLQTGKDEDGTTWPIWFNSLLDAKPALYSYLQMPFVATFGSTVTASRLPSAILGAISIPLVYWLLTFLVSKKHAALTSFLLLLSPWHIIVSRSTQEVILSFVFCLIAVGAFLSMLKNKNTQTKIFWFLVTIVSSALAMYAYHSAKVFLPALFLGWSFLELFIFKKSKETTNNFWLIFTNAAVIIVLLLLTFAIPNSVERFKAVGILSEQAPLLIAQEQIRTGTGSTPLLLLRFFYNKVVAYTLAIVNMYTHHFSLEFLFLSGGEPKRYLVPFHGLFYHIELILVPMGIFLGLHYEKYRRWTVYLLWWLLVAPLPAALTAQEIPSMIRIFPMVVPFVAFTAFALIWIWSKRRFVSTKFVLVGVLLGYLWGFSYFYQQFVVQQPRYHPWNRNRAEYTLAEYLAVSKNDYDLIHITALRDLYMYIAIFDTTVIADLQKTYPARKQESFQMDKYFFKESECAPPSYPEEQKVLYVVRANCDLPPGFRVIKTFSYDDKAQVYDLLIYDQELFKIWLQTQEVQG